jgi:oxygen-independent coproporphyrinogen-3 oxidase
MFEERVTSLYVHVPFCASKCAYCAFYSEPAEDELKNRYVNALVRELELVAGNLKPRTVYFGGGTPSLLRIEQWQRILESMERLNLLGADEWTIECNPATVSRAKAELFRSYGVNRISLGAQSLNGGILQRLGRIHTPEMVFESFDLLRSAGFDNISLDLMFAIPGQTLADWQETLERTIALGSEHLSCYEIIYEEDTPLFKQLQLTKNSVDEDLACDMYDRLLGVSAEKGFQQYEVANFARHISAHPAEIPDRACMHNVNYWRGGSFYGLGPSAASYVAGVRSKNYSNTALYCEHLERNSRAIETSEELSPLARAGELAAFGLRMNAGWPLKKFKERTGFDLREHWGEEIQKLIKLDYGRLGREHFQLTPKGLRYADWAAEMFLRS